MTQPDHLHPSPAGRNPCTTLASDQKGVVLIIAMIMLIVISMLAVNSLRNSASTEILTGNIRTTEMATQAADIALRHCESSTVEIMTVAGGGTSTGYVTAMTAANILAPSASPTWANIGTWDSVNASVYVLPLALVRDTTVGASYKRPPECMVERMSVILANSTAVSSTSSYVITARGFGPEVAAADAARSRPSGSEVWLQSHLELQ